ncbi:MAG: HyaD/HybD family hydrogenase maturation endopeptidase [Gammaproteobacteria bacterium]|nr:HyaD/HybD family hydrogenase maturation endopeptidase [Gammaproteobacteria bacterium]
MTVLILGVGNLLLGDEGVGVHAVRYLQQNVPFLEENIHLVDGGTLGFTLAAEMAAAEGLVVIDAARLGGQAGDVQLLEGEEMDRFVGRRDHTSVHEIGLRDLLATSRLLDELPQQRALVGIEPYSFDWGEELSSVVASALPLACELALSQSRSWSQ